jgi:hypothetical protein
MVRNPRVYIIVPLGIWRGCGIADSFNGIPSGCIVATMWTEYPLGPTAGRMRDLYCLGGVGDGQNRARNGSGTARADLCIGMLECSHEPTKVDSAESFLSMSPL